MFDINNVQFAGRLYDKRIMKNKKGTKEYAILTVVSNAAIYGGDKEKNKGTFANVMVFSTPLVDYIKGIEIEKGEFTIINGFLTNTRTPNKMTTLTLVARDVVFARSSKGDVNPSMEDVVSSMEDFDDDLF